jgi:hypothetical protein
MKPRHKRRGRNTAWASSWTLRPFVWRARLRVAPEGGSHNAAAVFFAPDGSASRPAHHRSRSRSRTGKGVTNTGRVSNPVKLDSVPQT